MLSNPTALPTRNGTRPASLTPIARRRSLLPTSGPIPGWIDGVRVVDPMLVAYGRGRLPEFPGKPGAVLDIVPVDHVAHAILAALAEIAELAGDPDAHPRQFPVEPPPDRPDHALDPRAGALRAPHPSRVRIRHGPVHPHGRRRHHHLHLGAQAGDIGRFDADGYLYIVGRSKDVIVTDAGKNVYPEEVEQRYRGVPGVQELVVLGLPSTPGAGWTSQGGKKRSRPLGPIARARAYTQSAGRAGLDDPERSNGHESS